MSARVRYVEQTDAGRVAVSNNATTVQLTVPAGAQLDPAAARRLASALNLGARAVEGRR